ncbi:MAG: flagellar motor protein MotB [Pyrinomonadaceae bacterium]
MEQDRTLDINFWTGFADLMLALVLVLCLLLFLVMAVISFGTVNLKSVQVNQQAMIESVANSFDSMPQMNEGSFLIPIIQNGKQFTIQVDNDLDTQKFTFSDRLLFLTDDFHLNEDGRDTLRIIGRAILMKAERIREIQIQGHADIRRSRRFHSETGNTELAAMRALEVFKFFQDKREVGIDPTKNLMSITSFGEFLPFRRKRNDTSYDMTKLATDNADVPLMDRNRRIEIVLFYRH